MANATETCMAERIETLLLRFESVALGCCSLSDDDDRKTGLPLCVPFFDLCANLIDVERLLWDQDHIGSTGYPCMQCDEARISSHDLKDHVAVVTASG